MTPGRKNARLVTRTKKSQALIGSQKPSTDDSSKRNSTLGLNKPFSYLILFYKLQYI